MGKRGEGSVLHLRRKRIQLPWILQKYVSFGENRNVPGVVGPGEMGKRGGGSVSRLRRRIVLSQHTSHGAYKGMPGGQGRG